MMPFWWDEKRVYNFVQQMCMRKGCLLLFFCLPALVVGLERTFYTVSESEEAVEICITAVGVNTPCPSTQSFEVTLSTTDGSAGI